MQWNKIKYQIDWKRSIKVYGLPVSCYSAQLTGKPYTLMLLIQSIWAMSIYLSSHLPFEQ